MKKNAPSLDYSDFKIKSGSDTNKLLDHVSHDELSKLLYNYKMDLGFRKQKQLPQSVFPKKSILNIFRELETLRQEKWLSESDIETVEMTIKESLIYSLKGSSFFSSRIAGVRGIYREKGSPIKNPALNVLILSLVSALSERTGKPNYSLIAGFLAEQGITDDSYGEDTIKKSFERNLQQFDKLAAFQKSLMTRLNIKLGLIARNIPNNVKSEIMEELEACLQKRT